MDDSIPKGFRDSKQMKEDGELVSHLVSDSLVLDVHIEFSH